MHELGCAHWNVHKSLQDEKRDRGRGKKRDEALAMRQEPGIAVLTLQHSLVELPGL